MGKKYHIDFAYELGGLTGEKLNLYEIGGEHYICVEGQTGTHQIEGRASLCNARLKMLYPVAQVNKRCLDTKGGLQKAIESFVKLHHPTSFVFIARQIGNSEKRATFRGKVEVEFPESPLKGKVKSISFA